MDLQPLCVYGCALLFHPVQAGYNFIFGLWKYQWDADCELFLRILLVNGLPLPCCACFLSQAGRNSKRHDCCTNCRAR